MIVQVSSIVKRNRCNSDVNETTFFFVEFRQKLKLFEFFNFSKIHQINIFNAENKTIGSIDAKMLKVENPERHEDSKR